MATEPTLAPAEPVTIMPQEGGIDAFLKTIPPEAFNQPAPTATAPGEAPQTPPEAPKAPAEAPKADEAPKAPEKAAEAKAEPAKKEDAPTVPKTAADWKKFHEKHESVKRELKAVTEKAAKVADLEPIAKERDTLRAQLEDVTKRLRTVAMERDPAIEAGFKAKTDMAVELAKAAVGHEKAEKVAKLLAMQPSEFRDKAIEKLAEDMGALQLGKLTHAVAQADAVWTERQQLSAKSAEYWQAEQTRKAQEMAAADAQNAAVFDSVIKKLKDPENGYGAFVEGDDADWNAGVAERIDLAKKIFSGKLGSVEDLAAASARAAAFDWQYDMLKGAAQEIVRLNEELSALKASNPTVKGDGNAGSGAGSDDQYDPAKHGSIGQFIAAQAQKLGAMAGR